MSDVDVVGIFDKDFNQLFPSATPMRAAVYEMAQMFKHPVEKSASVVDHRIIQPTEIDMIVKLTDETYQSAYKEIKNAWLLGSIFTVRTRADSYPNMVLGGLPHEETPDDGESLTMVLKFTELLTFEATYRALAPRRASDNNTVKKGEQAGKPSVAVRIVRAVKNWAHN